MGSRVFGVGVDVALVPRFARTLERFGERFERRALHPRELAELRARVAGPAERAAFVASRWAVKEAAFKAFHGHRVLFPELCVTRSAPELTHVTRLGAALPRGSREAPARVLGLELSGATAELAKQLRLEPPHVSLSHDGDYAVAFVVLEQRLPSEGDR